MTAPTRAAATVVALLAVVSCEAASSVDPDATVRISTRVVTSSGDPVDGATVRVAASGSLSDVFALLPPLSFVCVGGACDTLDGGVRTGPDGRAVVEGSGSSTRTIFGGERLVALAALDPAPAPSAALGRGSAVHYFTVRREETALPDLPLWRTAVRTQSAAGRVQVRYDAAPGGKAAHRLHVDDLQGNTLLSAAAGPTVGSFDERLLEDLSGRLRVVAVRDGRDVDTVLRSATYAVRGRLRPPSRGAACVRRDATGRSRLTRPCGLTDGDPLSEAPPRAGDCLTVTESRFPACDAQVRGVEVDLGGPRDVSLVVLRGLRSDVGVSVSADGRTWAPFGRTSDVAQAAGVDSRSSASVQGRARAARYVRVDTDDLAEVSVW